MATNKLLILLMALISMTPSCKKHQLDPETKARYVTFLRERYLNCDWEGNWEHCQAYDIRLAQMGE